MILEVNGSKIRDMPHEEVVNFIRQQSSEDAEAIHLTVVSKNELHEEEEVMNASAKVTTEKADS